MRSRVGLGARAGHRPGLEQRAHRGRQHEPVADRQLLQRVALGEHRAAVRHQLHRGVELPGAQRVANRPRKDPAAGKRERPGVGRPRRVPSVQERRFVVPDHPRSPQVGEPTAGLRLQQVQEAPPVRRSGNGLWRRADLRAARRDQRLVRPDPGPGVRPDPLQRRVAGALGDRLRHNHARGKPVSLDRGVRRAVAGPGVERDRGLGDGLGQDGTRALDLHRLGGPVRIEGRETLVRPSVGEQPAVEPAVGRLVDHDQRPGPVGDLDPALAAVEQPGVSTVVPAHGLLDDERTDVRPGDADVTAQGRERVPEQEPDPRGPTGIVLPRLEGEPDGLWTRGHSERRGLVDRRPLPRDEGVERERAREGPGLQHRAPIGGGAPPVEAAALHRHVVAGREPDADRAPPGTVGGKRPDGEHGEARADAHLALGRATGIGEVEGQAERVGGAAVETRPEADLEHGVAGRAPGHANLRAGPAGHVEALRARRDGDAGAVEVERVGLGLARVVAHRVVHHDVDTAPVRQDRVRGGSDEGEIRAGGRRLGGRKVTGDRAEQHGEQGGREREANRSGEDEAGRDPSPAGGTRAGDDHAWGCRTRGCDTHAGGDPDCGRLVRAGGDHTAASGPPPVSGSSSASSDA